MKNKYDTPEKMNILADSMDTFFRQLHQRDQPAGWLGREKCETVVPSGPMPVMYLPVSRLSFADDASIKGAQTKCRVRAASTTL